MPLISSAPARIELPEWTDIVLKELVPYDTDWYYVRAEDIMIVTETNSEEGEGRMLPYVLLLHAFCLVDPTLCAPVSDSSQFVITLQPYLKSQRCLCFAAKISGKGTSVIEYIVQLFYKRLDALGFDNKQEEAWMSITCMPYLIALETDPYTEILALLPFALDVRIKHEGLFAFITSTHRSDGDRMVQFDQTVNPGSEKTVASDGYHRISRGVTMVNIYLKMVDIRI
ncbi:hypothetical protein OROHE_026506 [Orobanche hederae]